MLMKWQGCRPAMSPVGGAYKEPSAYLRHRQQAQRVKFVFKHMHLHAQHRNHSHSSMGLLRQTILVNRALKICVHQIIANTARQNAVHACCTRHLQAFDNDKREAATNTTFPTPINLAHRLSFK